MGRPPPQPTPTPPPSNAPAYQWDWRQHYAYAAGYWQTIPVGFNAGIHLQAGAPFPPGYRIANGQKGGGYAASGATATGNEPIKIQPPPSGVGPLKFITLFKIVVMNDQTETGAYAFGLGVADVNGPNFPMYPYIGVGHDLDINQISPDTLNPGESRTLTTFRLDLMDNAFMGAQPIPTWPNWEMIPNTNNLLWPAVTPVFKNTGKVTLKVGNVFATAWTSP